MKKYKFATSCLLLSTALIFVDRLSASTVIYSENFTSTSLVSQMNPYLGGWFTPQTAFQIWNGPGEASITAGALTVTSTNGTRAAGILLSPGLFSTPGTYTLSFDVTAYSGSSNNSGLVTIWAGRGFDLSQSTGNALILDTLSAELKTAGSATATSFGSSSFTSGGNNKQISFSYDGSSAVALFFGAHTAGWPFPTVTYDNISISKNSLAAVPEPSVTALLALLASASCFTRRRA